MNRKSEIDRPTRVASYHTIRFVRPRSCIMKYSAEIMLAMISANAMGTSMCMKFTVVGGREGVRLIIAPRSGARQRFPFGCNGRAR